MAVFVVACSGGGGNAPLHYRPNASITAPSENTVRIREGESVVFAGACADPDGDAIAHRWVFPGGMPGASAAASPGAIVFQSAGTYVASYTCSDDEDTSLVDERTVIVAANQQPVAAITSPSEPAVTISEGESVSFAASCMDPEGDAVSHSWTFPGGAPEASTLAAPGDVSFAAAGTYGVSYACKDGKAEPVVASRTVTVLKRALRVSIQPPSSADVGTVLAPSAELRIVNAAGADLAQTNIPISVALGGGSGTLTGTTTRLTGADGSARFDDLAFTGLAAGVRTLEFSSSGLVGVSSIPIEVRAGPAAEMLAASAIDQDGRTGQLVVDPPAVRLRDAFGNSITGVPVAFTVTAGGGTLTGTPALTGADGVARAGAWTLGAPGAQAIEATAAGLPSVIFTADAASAAETYDVTIWELTALTSGQHAAFEAARERVERIVAADIPNTFVNVAAMPTCGNTPISGVVDDLLILVRIEPIDGYGGTLGRAGPCMIRTSSQLPVVGIMQFDSADLAQMESSGQLGSVILHEMLHVLGFGTMWPGLGLVSGTGTYDPVFVGSRARAAFTGFNGGAGYAGGIVPVENTGGEGTIHSHWRESVFMRELMTGWISGASQPMSRTTIESLADMGYAVDATLADPFDIASAALRSPEDEESVELTGEELVTPLFEVGEDGTAVPVP